MEINRNWKKKFSSIETVIQIRRSEIRQRRVRKRRRGKALSLISYRLSPFGLSYGPRLSPSRYSRKEKITLFSLSLSVTCPTKKLRRRLHCVWTWEALTTSFPPAAPPFFFCFHTKKEINKRASPRFNNRTQSVFCPARKCRETCREGLYRAQWESIIGIANKWRRAAAAAEVADDGGGSFQFHPKFSQPVWEEENLGSSSTWALLHQMGSLVRIGSWQSAMRVFDLDALLMTYEWRARLT